MSTTDETLKARPTVYKGIKMRSRLEAGYAAWLDEYRLSWKYEPCAFSDDSGRQYLPDFRIEGISVLGRPGPTTAYVEVKPSSWPTPRHRRLEAATTDELRAAFPTVFTLMDSMAVIHNSEPDAVLLLDSPRSTSSPRDNAFTRLVQQTEAAGGYWMQPACWCSIQGYGNGDISLGLAIPLAASRGPWFGEWWKGRVA